MRRPRHWLLTVGFALGACGGGPEEPAPGLLEGDWSTGCVAFDSDVQFIEDWTYTADTAERRVSVYFQSIDCSSLPFSEYVARGPYELGDPVGDFGDAYALDLTVELYTCVQNGGVAASFARAGTYHGIDDWEDGVVRDLLGIEGHFEWTPGTVLYRAVKLEQDRRAFRFGVADAFCFLDPEWGGTCPLTAEDREDSGFEPTFNLCSAAAIEADECYRRPLNYGYQTK